VHIAWERHQHDEHRDGSQHGEVAGPLALVGCSHDDLLNGGFHAVCYILQAYQSLSPRATFDLENIVDLRGRVVGG
jgi:hypothetical protein